MTIEYYPIACFKPVLQREISRLRKLVDTPPLVLNRSKSNDRDRWSLRILKAKYRILRSVVKQSDRPNRGLKRGSDTPASSSLPRLTIPGNGSIIDLISAFLTAFYYSKGANSKQGESLENCSDPAISYLDPGRRKFRNEAKARSFLFSLGADDSESLPKESAVLFLKTGLQQLEQTKYKWGFSAKAPFGCPSESLKCRETLYESGVRFAKSNQLILESRVDLTHVLISRNLIGIIPILELLTSETIYLRSCLTNDFLHQKSVHPFQFEDQFLVDLFVEVYLGFKYRFEPELSTMNKNQENGHTNFCSNADRFQSANDRQRYSSFMTLWGYQALVTLIKYLIINDVTKLLLLKDELVSTSDNFRNVLRVEIELFLSGLGMLSPVNTKGCTLGSRSIGLAYKLPNSLGLPKPGKKSYGFESPNREKDDAKPFFPDGNQSADLKQVIDRARNVVSVLGLG
jgi:hypothetical protein